MAFAAIALEAVRLGQGERISMDSGMSSCLFTLRLWHEQLGEGQMEWRGKVQYTASGETLYFRQWGLLLEFLQEILEPQTPGNELTEDEEKQGSRGPR